MRTRFVMACAGAALLVASCAMRGAPRETFAPERAGYESPERACEALVAALRSDDLESVRAVLGPGSDDLVDSGDAAADRIDRDTFVASYDEQHALLEQSREHERVLVVGKAAWPLPIPIVRDGELWYFDAARGHDELLARRIGRNELATIEVCESIVDAQAEYAAEDRGRGAGVYAARFASAPNEHDGLYWPARDGESESPLGALLAAATVEEERPVGQEPEPCRPYQGYVYRILTAQGPFAPGGARDYLVDGRLTGGFAVLAEPATYGNSGVMTFLVGPAGVVYERDLGADTAEIARTLRAFDPTPEWAVVR